MKWIAKQRIVLAREANGKYTIEPGDKVVGIKANFNNAICQISTVPINGTLQLGLGIFGGITTINQVELVKPMEYANEPVFIDQTYYYQYLGLTTLINRTTIFIVTYLEQCK